MGELKCVVAEPKNSALPKLRDWPMFDRLLLGGFVGSKIGRRLLAASFRNCVAKAIDVVEHVVEVLRRTLQLCPIIFAMKDVHGVLDGMEVVEKL
jgi:hypothetical protein